MPGPVLIAVVITLFAAGGAAAVTQLHFRHHAVHSEAGRNSGESARVAPPSAVGSAPAPSSPVPSASASVPGQLTITANASQDSSASSVATFLDEYFTAINSHDYQSYVGLLSAQAQQGLTQERFADGYGSTTDSAETLQGISTAADGDLVVSVTFTSHQDPADSPNKQDHCTDWSISLFLEQDGSGYLIDQPPSTYHAAYTACS